MVPNPSCGRDRDPDSGRLAPVPNPSYRHDCDPDLQVRCAAVFALGTFVGNSAERTDHSTTIDHNVAMMLAQLINDGSPMVRKVRDPASGYQWASPRLQAPSQGCPIRGASLHEV